MQHAALVQDNKYASGLDTRLQSEEFTRQGQPGCSIECQFQSVKEFDCHGPSNFNFKAAKPNI